MSGPVLRYNLRRAALTGVAIASFITAISATSAVLEAHADAGLVFDPETRTVTSVSPTGFAWRDGIRPGQQIVFIGSAEDPGGWRIETRSSSGLLESAEAPIAGALHTSLPFALLGVGAGIIGVFLLRTARDWVLPVAGLSLVGSSVPLFLANAENAGLTLALAALVPAAGLAWRLRRHPFIAGPIAIGAGLTVASWSVAWNAGFPDGETVEQLRRIIAVGATGILLVDRGRAGAYGGRPVVTRAHLVGDLVAVVAVAGTLAALYVAAFPAPVIAVVMLLGLLAAVPLRTFIGRRLEYALTADLRAQVSADIVEEERSRLARELHDVPLQQLSGVIRRLELVPAARSETGELLEIADGLRAVAIELHPPMLDDVGLGAALDFLAEHNCSDTLRVEAKIDDETVPYHRPPGPVEVAVYRIAHEAVMNAIAHAEARRVVVAAAISEDAIDLQIADDGIGLSDDDLHRASGRGRLGVSSMRRRARGIDADLSIDGGRDGTRVTVTWRA